jgi:hypothetical protein
VVRYSFLVGLFHSQQHAGLSRRSGDISTLNGNQDPKPLDLKGLVLLAVAELFVPVLNNLELENLLTETR